MSNNNMRPQDIVVLLKILSYKNAAWYSKDLANDLFLSTAEVSNSLNRSVASGLLDTAKRKVRARTLIEFIIYGLPHVFPQSPGSITRGIPTAHSYSAVKNKIISDELFVWPDPESNIKGYAVEPLYPGVVKAAKKDPNLYFSLAMVDILRLGKTREKKIAIGQLEKLLNEPSTKY